MRPIYGYMGALKIFWTPWLRPRLLFLKFYGLFFRWYRSKEHWWVPIVLHTYYSSNSTHLPEILDCSFGWGMCTPNFGGGRRSQRWYHSKERWWVPISPPYILFLYQHLFARNFRLQFWVGVANPQFWGRGGRRGSGIVPFERALVSFYRLSIETFPLYLYAFQRYRRFCSAACHFFLPHL